MLLILNVNKKSVPTIIRILERGVFRSSMLQNDSRAKAKEKRRLEKDRNFGSALIGEIEAQYLKA